MQPAHPQPIKKTQAQLIVDRLPNLSQTRPVPFPKRTLSHGLAECVIQRASDLRVLVRAPVWRLNQLYAISVRIEEVNQPPACDGA